MFTRQDVCAMTGIPVAAFKTRARRDQLPTVNVPSQGATDEIRDRAKERGWNWFSPVDVLLIAVQERLMMEIGYADGSSAATAAKIVECNAGDIGHMYWLASPTIGEPSPHDLWVGYLGYTDQGGRNSGGRNLGGDLVSVLGQLKADVEQQKARLVLVNASTVLRDIRNNAARFNITFPVPADWR
ncbi:hypothetical protein HZZ13_22010 [Bradyrhizobium sp. CNPSo 4010]|uniref:Uncharacterized protein n=1 Tax=Bradyrhizobium agreste TaxID=2751811 RepID=A0ABS0PTC7_9BRAD|nr:hypothetical protein [Bradyrhizobium agreste]MBH5400446.1 hypothetical protein [Bradyrhizobium agreste]